MKKIFFLSGVILVSSYCLRSQSVGIGTSSPNSSSQLDISSTTKGTLITRMTTAQRKAISSPAAGLLVYDQEKKTIYMFDGFRWEPFLFTTNETKLPPTPADASDGAVGDNFGYSVSISGDYAIVGTKNIGTNAGAAYIFFRNAGTWQQQAKLIASDGVTGDGFGQAVSINGDYAIVGAPTNDEGANGNQGRAYIFFRTGTTWTEQASFTPSDGAASDLFGSSVSIYGDYAVVSSYADDVTFNNQGSVYVYYRGAGWTNNQAFQAKLTASDGALNDNFGYSVSIYGDYIIVGAYHDDVSFADQGSAYIFYRGAGWTTGQAYQAKLTASDGEASDFFGCSVSIYGDYIIIGAYGDDFPSTDQGSAYIYYRGSGWTTGQSYQTKLQATDAQTGDAFGISVNISDTYVIIGANADDQTFMDQGSTYVYKRSGVSVWQLLRKIDDDNPQGNGSFGFSVGISGFNVIIGAYNKLTTKGEASFLNFE